MPLPKVAKMGIFIKKFHYKEKPMFGIEPNLDKVFGKMLMKPQQQKLVDYQAYRIERGLFFVLVSLYFFIHETI